MHALIKAGKTRVDPGQKVPGEWDQRMKKRIWDLYAPIYKRAMRSDQMIYDFMYERIPDRILDKEVLIKRDGRLIGRPTYPIVIAKGSSL